MVDTPTFREMNLNVFRGKPNPHVLFQPRFEPWFAWNRQFDSLPDECRNYADVRDAYDAIGCSQRYMHYYTDIPSPVTGRFTDEVTFTTEQQGDISHRHYHTPHGDLTETSEFSVDKVWRVVDYCGKRVEDLPAIRWLVERRIFEFSTENFRVGDAFIGDRGVPQFWVPKSPYLALCQTWMNFEPFMYAMADAPDVMVDLMQAIDRSYDTLYEQMCSSGLVQIINFGENVAEAHWSPEYFDRYMLPWAEKRVGQLHDAGIFAHIHIDGYFKNLVPNIRKLPHDGLEALTPLPQGDVTIDEMAEACDGKVLLDGIPAILFLDHHPRKELEQCVEQIIDTFDGKLILGISDELPEAGNTESYERMKWVADRCHG